MKKLLSLFLVLSLTSCAAVIQKRKEIESSVRFTKNDKVVKHCKYIQQVSTRSRYIESAVFDLKEQAFELNANTVLLTLNSSNIKEESVGSGDKKRKKMYNEQYILAEVYQCIR